MPVNKVALDDTSIPCLKCDKKVDIYHNMTAAELPSASLNKGIEVRTFGNYGSQVHDMSGTLHFVLCDECVIRTSHKMVHSPPDLYPKAAQNGRDYFEEWREDIIRRPDGHQYNLDVLPYFREKVNRGEQ